MPRFVNIAVQDPPKYYRNGPEDVFRDRRLDEHERVSLLTTWKERDPGNAEVAAALERAKAEAPSDKHSFGRKRY